MQGVVEHRLSEIDPESQTAICSKCGPVGTLVDNGKGTPACSVRVRANKRKYLLMRRYGVTIEEWNERLIAQSGRCASCGDPMRNPHLDHCHTTTEARGLLCSPCNQGLGFFYDDPARLAAAIRYLTGGVSD